MALALTIISISADDQNQGRTLPYEYCNRDSNKECVDYYCCSSNVLKEGETTPLTAQCMPSDLGTSTNSVTYRKYSDEDIDLTTVDADTELFDYDDGLWITGGENDSTYTWSCDSGATGLVGA